MRAGTGAAGEMRGAGDEGVRGKDGGGVEDVGGRFVGRGADGRWGTGFEQWPFKTSNVFLTF